MSTKFVSPNFEVLRRQLAEVGDHVGPAILDVSARPAERLEHVAIRLGGAARLAMQLRAAMNAESQGDPPNAA